VLTIYSMDLLPSSTYKYNYTSQITWTN
jgi:hypothetical protein